MLRRSAVKPVADHDWLVEGAADWSRQGRVLTGLALPQVTGEITRDASGCCGDHERPP